MALTIPRTQPRAHTPMFGSTPPGLGIDIGVFAYVFPGDPYLTALTTPATVPTPPVFVVLNVASGQDDDVATLDPTADQLRARATRGNNRATPTTRALGYVTTYDYGTPGLRPIGDVKADIDRWLKDTNPERATAGPHYNGIFFDSVTRDAGASNVNLDFHAELAAYTRALLAGHGVDVLLVGNPGTAIEDVYLAADVYDRYVTFEGTYAQYQAGGGTQWAAAPGNTWNLGDGYYDGRVEWGDRFVHIVHTTPVGNHRTAIDMAAGRGAGVVFVTDDTTPNPYDTTPAYLKVAVDYVNNIG